MLILGRTNVALFSGCFCLVFSDICTPVSGSGTGPFSGETTGEPAGDELADADATNRLSPNPNLPERAVSVPPTAAPTDEAEPEPDPLAAIELELTSRPEVDAPEEPRIVSPSTASKNCLALPCTTLAVPMTISRNLFPRVGLAGGGGGFRIPLAGGFGRLRAGEGGGTAACRGAEMSAVDGAETTTTGVAISGAGASSIGRDASRLGRETELSSVWAVARGFSVTGISSTMGTGESTVSDIALRALYECRCQSWRVVCSLHRGTMITIATWL
jgi:hypothetical protein